MSLITDWSGNMSNKLEKIPNELKLLFMLMVGNILSILFYKSVNMEVPNNLINTTFNSIDRYQKSFERVFRLMYE